MQEKHFYTNNKQLTHREEMLLYYSIRYNYQSSFYVRKYYPDGSIRNLHPLSPVDKNKYLYLGNKYSTISDKMS